MQLAVALYNNDVDDEDELEFRKGDVLTVLIENPNGLNGWWLCEHKGKCGLCPANRLRPASNAGISISRSSDQTRSSSRLSTASVSVVETSNITAIDSWSCRCTMVYRVITISRSQPLQRRHRLPPHRHHPTMIMISHMHQVGTIEWPKEDVVSGKTCAAFKSTSVGCEQYTEENDVHPVVFELIFCFVCLDFISSSKAAVPIDSSPESSSRSSGIYSSADLRLSDLSSSSLSEFHTSTMNSSPNNPSRSLSSSERV